MPWPIIYTRILLLLGLWTWRKCDGNEEENCGKTNSANLSAAKLRAFMFYWEWLSCSQSSLLTSTWLVKMTEMKEKGQTVATFQLQRSGRLCFVESGLVAVRCENPAEMHLVRKIRSGKTESRPPHQEGCELRGQKGVTYKQPKLFRFLQRLLKSCGKPV